MSVFEADLPKPGRKFDERFVITSKLGEGGMGIVYLARQEELDRDVAIKFLKPNIYADEDGLKRFEREALTLSKLRHPNIASFYSYGIWSGYAYYAMEFVRGKSLQEIVAEKKVLSKDEFNNIARQMFDALEHAHEQGIIHRDLKPANMLVNEKGQLKIIDFGLAKFLPLDGEDFEKLTQTGIMLGTAVYASPEQCLGQHPDARCDIYACGCILHEMLTGRPPFYADTNMGVMYKHLHEQLSVIEGEQGPIPQAVQDVVLRALEKEPDKRYQTVHQMAEELLNVDWLKKNSVASGKAVSKARLAVLALAAVTLTGVYFWVLNLEKVEDVEKVEVYQTIRPPLADSPIGDDVLAQRLDANYRVRQELNPFYSRVNDLMRAGRFKEAAAQLDSGEKVASKAAGSLFYADFLMTKAQVLLAVDRFDDAVAAYQQAEDGYERHHQRARKLTAQSGRAQCYARMNKLKEALLLSDSLWPDRQLLLNPRERESFSQARVFVLRYEAGQLIAEGKLKPAWVKLRNLARLAEVELGPDNPEKGNVYAVIGQVYFKEGKYAECEQALRRARKIFANAHQHTRNWYAINELLVRTLALEGKWKEVLAEADSLLKETNYPNIEPYVAALKLHRQHALKNLGAG